MKERTEPLSELDAGSVLEEMEKLEQSGTTFQNKQRQDVRIRYVAPIVVAAVMVALMGALPALMIWAYASDPDNAPPLAVLIPLIAIFGLGICGILYALFQRITEISKGEIDDAKQY